MAADSTAVTELVQQLWERSRPATEAKLLVMARAARAAAEGTLSPTNRMEAASAAHKLAGSLGMFGFPAGTALARVAEQQLDGMEPIDSHELARTVAALRLELGL